MGSSRFAVAVAQASPVFLDAAATIEKACELIGQAAREGAKLIVLPEAFVPGYPDWVWVLPPGPQKAAIDEMNALLLSQSVGLDDASLAKLCRAVKSAKVFVCIGVHERNTESSNSSLFNTLLFIDDRGNIAGRHRKLIPSGAERLVWARGDGSTLQAYDTPFGKIGGLICWENFMPLARQALYGKGVQIHVAPTWDSSDGWLVTMQHIAKEGGMYVLSCCQAIHIDEIPDQHPFKGFYPEGKQWLNRGNSCIVDPKGRIIAGPLAEEQGILYAEIDLNKIAEWKWLFDAAGHYSRPDVFEFKIRSDRDLAGDGL